MGAGVAINASNPVGNEDSVENQSMLRYKTPSLDHLTNRTKFSRKEIQSIYQGFKQECPSGIIDEENFQQIYQQFFPSADVSSYAHLIFSTLDLRASGWVTFEDFLVCLSTLCRGTVEDRLKWIFNLYDTNKCGKVTRKDFHAIFSAVYRLVGDASNGELFEERIGKIYQKFDSIEQGYITWENFLSFCLQDSMIIQSIESLRLIV